MNFKNLTLIILKFVFQIVAYVACYELLLMFFKAAYGKPGLSLGLGAHYTLYVIVIFAAIQSSYFKSLNFKISYWLVLSGFLIFHILFFGAYKFNLITILPSMMISSILAMSLNLVGESKTKTMQVEKFSDEWLFQDHSKSEIMDWIQNLKYFNFFRAWGGLNNDGDKFEATFNFNSKEDLLEKLSGLGVIINFVPDNTPQPVAGVSYPSAEYWKFKILVRQFPDMEQPGSSKINDLPCFIYIGQNYFQISIAGKDGNEYHVTNSDFEVAKKLEIFFDALPKKLEPDFEIEKNAGCISRAKYPELYKE